MKDFTSRLSDFSKDLEKSLKKHQLAIKAYPVIVEGKLDAEIKVHDLIKEKDGGTR